MPRPRASTPRASRPSCSRARTGTPHRRSPAASPATWSTSSRSSAASSPSPTSAAPTSRRPTWRALASDIRVAALVANKPGIITVHTGVKPGGLELILEVVGRHGMRRGHVRPHPHQPQECGTDRPGARAGAPGRGGGRHLHELSPPAADAPHLTAADFAVLADANGVFDRVAFSSDAGGSLPVWNEDRSRIVGMGIGTPGIAPGRAVAPGEREGHRRWKKPFAP